jgi:hypothetical protein
MFGTVSSVRLLFPWMLVDEGVYEMINCILHLFAKVRDGRVSTACVRALAPIRRPPPSIVPIGDSPSVLSAAARRSRGAAAAARWGWGGMPWQFAFTHLLCHDFCLSVTERTMMSVRKKEQENKTIMLDKMQEVRPPDSRRDGDSSVWNRAVYFVVE